MTKEEMLNKQDIWISSSLLLVMDEYAKQQAIAFMRHCLENGHLDSFDSGGVWLDYSYWHDPQFTLVVAELYSQFIEQQTKEQ